MFPERLNQLISEKQINARQLSLASDITERLIGYWKKGEKQPTLENLVKLADFFDVSIDYLVGRDDISGKKEDHQVDQNYAEISKIVHLWQTNDVNMYLDAGWKIIAHASGNDVDGPPSIMYSLAWYGGNPQYPRKSYSGDDFFSDTRPNA